MKLSIYILAIALVTSVISVTSAQTTPVVFPLNSLFGGAALNKPLTITAANSLVTDGQNLWAGTYTIVPASTTNPIVSLYPNTYLLTVPGVVKSARFTVPSVAAGGSPVDVTTLLTSGPLLYLGANGLANLVAGTNILLMTNSDGSITLSDPFALTTTSAVSMTQVTGTLPASQLPSGVVTNGQPTFAQNLCLWLNAAQAYKFNPSLTNGAPVGIVDYSASNNVVTNLNGGCTFSSYGMAATSFYFASSRFVVSNLFCTATFGSNVTIAVTFRDIGGDGAGQNFLWTTLGTGGRNNMFRTWIANDGTTSYAWTGGEAWYNLGIGGQVHGGVQQRQFGTHVAVLVFSGSTSNAWCSLDGKPTFDDRLQSPGLHLNSWALTTNLYVGGDTVASSFFQGYISDFRVYNYAMPDNNRFQLEAFLCQQAGILQNVIIWDGDSKAQGLHTSAILTGPSQLLAVYFPNYLWNVTAESGRNSGNQLTNAYSWMPTVPRGLAYDAQTIGCNDFFTLIGAAAVQAQMPITCSNILNYALCAQSNGIPLALGTVTSVYWETNGLPAYDWRSNLNAFIRSITNLAKVMDFAAVPSIGTNSASLNTAFFAADGTHENSVGYTNWFNVALPVFQAMINGGGPSNYQSANSVLNQLTSLDDYMSIDQQDPYDISTTILPQINGSYYGVGKLLSASSTAFYFAPPRWPLFQWSGFTNQVFCIHIFATNGATVFWTANVRYWTNGLASGSGSGVQQRNFAAGTFQCSAGVTNDYWVTATNNWPLTTMTNVTMATFFFGAGNPTTNVWVIEGTHIHAQ